MFLLIKQHSWVILAKTKIPFWDERGPCATVRAEAASGSFASSKTHSCQEKTDMESESQT